MKDWPKYSKGDDIKAHFEGHEVGTTDAMKGTFDHIPFHIFTVK